MCTQEADRSTSSWTKHHPGKGTGVEQTLGLDSGDVPLLCCGIPSGHAEGDMGQYPRELALGGLLCSSPGTLLVRGHPERLPEGGEDLSQALGSKGLGFASANKVELQGWCGQEVQDRKY